MPIFVVIPKTPQDRAAVKAKLLTEFRDDHLELLSESFLVSSPGTSVQVSDRLGITTDGQSVGPAPSCIVFTITGYFGRAPNNVWEWLKEKMEGGGRAP